MWFGGGRVYTPQIPYPPYSTPQIPYPWKEHGTRDTLPPVDRMTHICENIIFSQLRWRVVMMQLFKGNYVKFPVPPDLLCANTLTGKQR